MTQNEVVTQLINSHRKDAMTTEEATQFARQCFSDRGVIVSESWTTNDFPGDHYFSHGTSCHSRLFDGQNYIHFHSGKAPWAEKELPPDAPMHRIRQMTVNGVDIPASECFPC